MVRRFSGESRGGSVLTGRFAPGLSASVLSEMVGRAEVEDKEDEEDEEREVE